MTNTCDSIRGLLSSSLKFVKSFLRYFLNYLFRSSVGDILNNGNLSKQPKNTAGKGLNPNWVFFRTMNLPNGLLVEGSFLGNIGSNAKQFSLQVT